MSREDDLAFLVKTGQIKEEPKGKAATNKNDEE
jgi:hypothetical protein